MVIQSDKKKLKTQGAQQGYQDTIASQSSISFEKSSENWNLNQKFWFYVILAIATNRTSYFYKNCRKKSLKIYCCLAKSEL